MLNKGSLYKNEGLREVFLVVVIVVLNLISNWECKHYYIKDSFIFFLFSHQWNKAVAINGDSQSFFNKQIIIIFILLRKLLYIYVILKIYINKYVF